MNRIIKNYVSVLLGVALIFSSLNMVSVASGETSPLITNGDFESKYEGYTVTSTATAQITSKDVHGGNLSLKVGGTTYADYGQIIYNQVSVEKNTDYIWSFWYKSNTDKAALVAVMTKGGSRLLPSFIKTFAPHNKGKKSFVDIRDKTHENWHESLKSEHWKKYSVVFNSGNYTSVRLAIDLVNSERSGFTDDWSLEKYDFVSGDADNDGRTEASDLVEVKRQLVTSKGTFYKNGADMDKNGKVDLIDLIRLKKELVQTVDAYPEINGVNLYDYAIIYSDSDYDYSYRAAEYIYSEILKRTGIELAVYEEDEKSDFKQEIVVGETWRDISAKLNADTKGTQFAILADKTGIALEGDRFVIAAAAYYFVDKYIANGSLKTNVPKTAKVYNPIVKKAKNYIILIGDGMGPNQTLLFDTMTDVSGYSDNEKQFYGYYLPYSGFARTNSLSGTTDSAAAGTALAAGYKTVNGYVGQDKNHNPIQSLTELAASKGMSTAVMSTEGTTGATPAAFSSHANSRYDSDVILSCQKEMTNTYGSIIKGSFDYYDKEGIATLEKNITNTLDALGNNEKGFFMMYEEAYIDKHGHNMNINNAFKAVIRFNQAIARFMEYAFYNPETFILITADHETGNLLPDNNGGYSYNCGDHTSRDVPVFAYGSGAELFGGKTVENVQIPMTIASFMEVFDFGDQTIYKYLS